MTFTFANSKVNKTVLSYFLNKNNCTDVKGRFNYWKNAYYYSNQQTEWAFTLGEELFVNSDLIWDYLKGFDANIMDLNVSTLGMLKTCYGFSIMSNLFSGALLSDVNLLISAIGLDESYAAVLPLIGGLVSSFENIGNYIVEEYLANPKFLSHYGGNCVY